MWVMAEEPQSFTFRLYQKSALNSSIYPFISYPLSSVHKAIQATWKWYLLSALLTSILDDPEAHKNVKTTASSCAYIRPDSSLRRLPFGLWELEDTTKELLEGHPGKVTSEAHWKCIIHALEFLLYKAQKLSEGIIF